MEGEMDFDTFGREEGPDIDDEEFESLLDYLMGGELTDINDEEFDAIMEHLFEDEATFDYLDRELPDINDEEYESIMPKTQDVDPREFYDTLKRMYGSNWPLVAERLNIMWREKNPGEISPSYLVKGLIRKAQMGYREFHRIIRKVKKSFPNARFLRLKFREQGDQLQVKPWGEGKWMNVYEGDDLNSNLSPFVIKALGTRDINKTIMEEEIMKTIRKEYPDAKFDLLSLRYGPRNEIQLKYLGKTTKFKSGWFDFKKLDGRLNTKLNPFLPDVISKRLGAPTVAVRMENVDSQMAQLPRKAQLKRDIRDRIKELTNPSLSLKDRKAQLDLLEEQINDRTSGTLKEQLRGVIDRLKEVKDAQVQVDSLGEQIEGSYGADLEDLLEEKNSLLSEEAKYEEDIRRRDASIEELNADKERLENIILDSERTEEERMVAQVKADLIEELIEELQEQNEQTENRLGLSTKERIMRMLKKYGIPAALASMLAAVISLVIALGRSIKQNGIALERQGKETASKNPGILGSVVALIEKTAGRILKFVGNNIWILVVAVGLLVLLKI